jgi:hypothetical protein
LGRRLILIERGQRRAILVLVDLLFQFNARVAPIFRPPALIVTLRKRLPRREPLFFASSQISIRVSQEKTMPA